MEPITGIFIFLITVGLGEEIKENRNQIESQQVEIENLNRDFLKLAGAHSAFRANQKHNNRDQQAQIDALNDTQESMQDKIDYLNEKIDILHP